MTAMTPQQTCARALDRLDEVGWQQGIMGGPEGPNSVMGLLQYASGEWSGNYDARNHLRSILHAQTGSVNLAYWNDVPTRTTDEVRALLQQGAETP